MLLCWLFQVQQWQHIFLLLLTGALLDVALSDLEPEDPTYSCLDPSRDSRKCGELLLFTCDRKQHLGGLNNAAIATSSCRVDNVVRLERANHFRCTANLSEIGSRFAFNASLMGTRMTRDYCTVLYNSTYSTPNSISNHFNNSFDHQVLETSWTCVLLYRIEGSSRLVLEQDLSRNKTEVRAFSSIPNITTKMVPLDWEVTEAQLNETRVEFTVNCKFYTNTAKVCDMCKIISFKFCTYCTNRQ